MNFWISFFKCCLFFFNFKSVWKNSSSCFECGRDCAYKISSFFCGICIALGWGCSFGCLSFGIIWALTPSLRFLNILLHPVKKFISIFLSAFMGPCMETIGLIFSRIHVTNSQGPPPRPLSAMDRQHA